MKNRYYFCIFILICCSSIFQSCGNETVVDADIYLNIPDEVKTLQFKQDAQMKTAMIETNSQDWEIKSDMSWCEVSRIKSNSQMFQLILEKNNEPTVRQAQLTLQTSGIVKTITVQQLGTSPAILLNPSSLDKLPPTASETELIVTTNLAKEDIEFVIPAADQDWISINKQPESRAMVDYNYILRVESNPKTTIRNSIVVVRSMRDSDDLTVELPITQEKRSSDAGDLEVDGDVKIVPTSGKDNQHHAGQGIENTFDGVISSAKPYHSPWSTDNPATVFPVVLEYFFDGKEDIDYILYYPNGGNGNFGKFTLYVANATNDDYREMGSYDFKESSDLSKIVLDKTLIGATKIKFEIHSGAGGFASCSEMEFYKKLTDKPLHTQLLTVFKDLTCIELRDDATEADINALPGFFANLAISIRDNTISDWEQEFRVQDYIPYSDVNVWAQRLMTKRYSRLDNITGIFTKAGEELVVLVGDTHGQNISLQCVGESAGSNGANQVDSGGESFFLEEGVNKIKINKTGMLFVIYTAPPISKPIRIHIPIGGGTVSGFFDLDKHKTDSKYSDLLSKATYKYFGVKGHSIMFYFHTSKMKEYVPNQILPSINMWDNIISWQQELMGIDDVRPSQVNNRILAISPESGYMWASDDRIGFVYTYLDNILLPQKVMAEEDNAWGPGHEIGHIHQAAINWVGSTESSNNLFSNYVIHKLGKFSSRGFGLNRVAESIYANQQGWWNMGNSTADSEDTELHLRLNWQLWNYYHRCGHKPTFWQELFAELRKTPISESDPGQKQMLFAKMAAKVAREDLSEFFEQWGFFIPVNNESITQYVTVNYNVTQTMIDDVKNYMSQFPKPKQAVQYIEDRKREQFVPSDYRYAEVGDVGHFEQFQKNTKITKNITYKTYEETRANSKGQQELVVTTEVLNGDQAIAFEWRRDGKIVYFGNSFRFHTSKTKVSLKDAQLYAVQADGKRFEITKAN